MISESLLNKIQSDNSPLASFLKELVHELKLSQVAIKAQAELIDKLYNGLNHPTCRVYRDSAQTIPHDTATVVAFTTVRWNTHNMFDSTNYSIVVPYDGVYLVGGHVRWATNATGIRRLALRVNGSTFVGVQDLPNGSSVDKVSNQSISLISLSALDYVQVLVTQQSTADLDIEYSAQRTPEFWCARIVDPVILSLYQQSLGRQNDVA